MKSGMDFRNTIGTVYRFGGDCMDSLKYFTPQQLKMVQIACEMRYYAERCYNPVPDLLSLVQQWYLKVSPTIPLFSVIMVYEWLKDNGYYDPYDYRSEQA